jgi:hypothetical protein
VWVINNQKLYEIAGMLDVDVRTLFEPDIEEATKQIWAKINVGNS